MSVTFALLVAFVLLVMRVSAQDACDGNIMSRIKGSNLTPPPKEEYLEGLCLKFIAVPRAYHDDNIKSVVFDTHPSNNSKTFSADVIFYADDEGLDKRCDQTIYTDCGDAYSYEVQDLTTNTTKKSYSWLVGDLLMTYLCNEDSTTFTRRPFYSVKAEISNCNTTLLQLKAAYDSIYLVNGNEPVLMERLHEPPTSTCA